MVPTGSLGSVWALGYVALRSLVGLPEVACCLQQPFLLGWAGTPFPDWYGTNRVVHGLLF